MKRTLHKRLGCMAGLLMLTAGTAVAAAPGSTYAARDTEAAYRRFNKEVTGQVKDSTGTGLPGVTIVVKGNPRIGTTTDVNGKFILDVPDNTLVLIFSMVGFAQQEVPLNGKTNLNVTLAPNDGQLNETVIVGFGKQKKASVVGSITTINPGELKTPSSNLTTALAGRLAGVIAYQRSGEPGMDNAEFFIRGATTFGYKKDPLILIDGIEYSTTELARLQPDDIASFSILKDASANAVYGARGANGVILITTKQGVAGKPIFNLRLENSSSRPTRNVELADPVTFMKMHNEAVATRNPLAPLPYPESKIDNTIDNVNPIVFPKTDWKKMLFRDKTNNQRANFNLSGGGPGATYYVSGGATRDNGNLIVDGRNNFNTNIRLNTYNLRANVNLNVTKSTEVKVRLHGTFDEYTGPIDGGKGVYQKVMRASQVRFPAYYPVDEDHIFTNHILFGNDDEGQFLNPYADMVRGYRNYSRSLMLAQVELRQDLSSILTKGLSVRAMLNTNREAFFDVYRSYSPFYYRIGSYDRPSNSYKLFNINPTTGTDYLNFTPTQKTVESVFYLESALDYNNNFGKHAVGGMLIFIARGKQEDPAGTGIVGLQRSLPARNLGLSGRATYAYDDRYFLEFNFGYNGSERFYKTERYGFFPTVGGAWYISNEDFFEPYRKVVTKLKVRGNYGRVGNDAIGNKEERFFYLSNVNMNDGGKGASFGDGGGRYLSGISVSRYDNRAITWETAQNSTYGVEIGLFGKLDMILEYFTEHRYNILMTRASIPKTLGLQGATPKANVGEASSKSYEASLDYNARLGKKTFLTVRGNMTFSRNFFMAYEEPVYKEPWRYRKNRPINQQWGYIAERLFIDDEEVRSSPTQNFGSFITRAGDIKFRDINGDKIIDERDMVPIGFPDKPEIVYGFGFTFKHGGFDFSTFFQGSARESFWIDPVMTAPFLDTDNTFQVSETQVLKAYADSYWSEENRNLYALWPRLSPTINTNSTQNNTWFMRNGAFLRLKQIEFGYSIPDHIARRLHTKNIRLYGTATNLLTFSKFKLWDVEMAGEGLGYPIQKVLNLGLQIGFQ